MSESLTHDALLRSPRPQNGRPVRSGGAPAPPAHVMTSVDKLEATERAFLARCLAVKQPGRRALEAMDLDAMFSTELTRRAARYLAEHLDHPGQALPAGADDLARLVAKLVIDSGELAADGDALALEHLTLEKLRLDREISAAQRAGEPPHALAAERQRVQSDLDHRQSAYLTRPLHGR
jgi:DNA primase